MLQIDIDRVFGNGVIGWLLLLTYILAFLFIFFVLLKKVKLLTKTTLITTTFSFLFPFLFFVLNENFLLKSTPPDTIVYATIIHDFSEYFNTYSFGVLGYSILSYIPFKLCFGMPLVFISFNIFYYQIAVLYLFKAFKIYGNYHNKVIGNNVFVFMQIAATMYPIGMIHVSSILREPMMLLFFSINIYFLTKYHFTNFTNYFVLSISLLFLFIIRPLTGIAMLIAFLSSYIYVKRLFTFRNLLKLSVVGILAFILTKNIILSIYNLDFSLDWIIKYRAESNAKFGIEGYHALNWDGFFHTIKNVFLLVSQYLFSPIPILVDKQVMYNKLIPTIDTLFNSLFIFLPILIYRKRFFKTWMICFLIFIIIPALFETNISGAYRHRMNGIFMLIPLTSYIFSRIRTKPT